MTIQEAIVRLLSERPMQFDVLRRHPWLSGLHFRSIDRELQKLRRAGGIAYDRKERVWRCATGEPE